MNKDRNTNDRSSFIVRDGDANHDSESRGSFRRDPPVVPERVAVLKANYKQAWFYFLLGLCLLIAWGIPIRYALIRTLAFRPAEVGERSAIEFIALSYEGISDIPTEVSPTTFKSQMQLLKKNGYNTITLEEVRAFYEEGKLLPEKAILLTFDHSRKSSYFDARRVLQRLGWQAVMFVWTKPILDEDPSALRWPYIRAMIGSGAWEAGAQSHMGFERIVSDSEGNLSNYLTTPKWLTDQNRYETPEEYQARLEQDHEFVYNRIVEETKTPPIAFAFPYGDFGQYDERALLTRRINIDLVDQFYDLAFIHGNAGLNTKHMDPLRLNRLLVDPEWSAEDLLVHLESAWPKQQGVHGESALVDPLDWQRDWGGFELKDNQVRIYALPNNTGSKVWLNGTDLYRDFQARFTLEIKEGQVGLFLRATKDGERYLYLAFGDQGEVWLRQKKQGLEPFTLGTSRYVKEEDDTVELDLYLRGNHFYASTGGKPMFDEIVMTRGDVEPGMVGFSVWDPEKNKADFVIKDIEINPIQNFIVTWDSTMIQQPYLAGWLGENGYRYTHLSPPWLSLGTQGRMEQRAWNPELYAELAQVYSMLFAPEIRVERIESVDPLVAESLASQAAAIRADALFCNLTNLRGNSNLSRISSWIQNMSKALEGKNILLIISLPPSLAQESSINSLLQGLDNLKIASPKDEIVKLEKIETTFRRLVPWEHATITRKEYPLFNQLDETEVKDQSWGEEVRSNVLSEQGFAALKIGQFDQALDLWSRWSRLEPHNEKPLRYMGDAYQLKKEPALAVKSYKESLALNPGQVDLVVATADLLERSLGLTEESLELLALYQRLFPDNAEIALAQASALLREGKQVQATRRIKQLIKMNPDDLTALALLHPLLQSPRERIENISAFADVGKRLGVAEHFAKTIHAYDLLIWPESWRLLEIISKRATEEQKEAMLYQQLLPRETVVREKFKLGDLSDHWEIPNSSSENSEEGTLLLSAAPTGTEAPLVLKGSKVLQNGFIEAQLESPRGFFWLYARRSPGNMIRFGFEKQGKLYLQIWMNDQLVTNINREWESLEESVNLKMEIRGDAVFGYLNGKTAFGSPVQIPEKMNLGWWGMAPWSPNFGVAQVVVREVAGGPLPLNVGIYRGAMTEDTDDILVEKLKANTDQLSVFSPNWFYQDATGKIRSNINFGLPGVRLFTRYYKIRLYPLIFTSSITNLNTDELVRLAETTKVQGFTLEVRAMPNEEWFDKMEDELIGKDIGLLVLHLNRKEKIVYVRELGSAPTLIAGAREVKPFSLVDFTIPDYPVIPDQESLPVVETVPVTPPLVDDDPAETPKVIQPVLIKPEVAKPMVPNTIYFF